jgi:hypothetical protein
MDSRQCGHSSRSSRRRGASNGVLLTLALVGVIGVAVGIHVHQTVKESQRGYHVFECAQCGRQFRVSMEDPECLQTHLGPYGVTKVCPRCHQKAALCTIACPACGKQVLRPPSNICPACGRNMIEVVNRKTAQALERSGVRRSTTTGQSMAPRLRNGEPMDAISLQAVDLLGRCEQSLAPQASTGTAAGDLAWARSYVMTAYQTMYETTGDPKYLAPLLEHVRQVLACRSDRLGQTDQVRGLAMPSWVSTSSESRPYAWLVHAGMITYPLAACAATLAADPALAQEHAQLLAQIRADVAQTIRAFEPDFRPGPGPDEGHYFCPLLQADLPFNQQNALGRAMLAMHDATGDPWYRQRAGELARYFRNRIRLADGRATWPASAGEDQAEDIAHAAIDVDFAVACYRKDLVFTRQDMQQMAATFNGLVCTGGFADRVDGSGTDGQCVRAVGMWGRLGGVDPHIRQVLADYLGAHCLENPAMGMLSAAYLAATQPPRARPATSPNAAQPRQKPTSPRHPPPPDHTAM